MKLAFLLVLISSLALSQSLQDKADSQQSEIHYAVAKQLYNQGDFTDAIFELKKTIDVGHVHLPTLELLAICYEKIEKHNEAIRTYYYLIKYTDSDLILKTRSQDVVKSETNRIKSLSDDKLPRYFYGVAKNYQKLTESLLKTAAIDTAIKLSIKYYEITKELNFLTDEVSVELAKLYKMDDKNSRLVKEVLSVDKKGVDNQTKDLMNYYLADSLYLKGHDHHAARVLKSVLDSSNSSSQIKSFVKKYHRYMTREKLQLNGGIGMGVDSNPGLAVQNEYKFKRTSQIVNDADNFNKLNASVRYNTEGIEKRHYFSLAIEQTSYSTEELSNFRIIDADYRYLSTDSSSDLFLDIFYSKYQSPRDINTSYKDSFDKRGLRVSKNTFYKTFGLEYGVTFDDRYSYILDDSARQITGHLQLTTLSGNEYFSPYYAATLGRYFGRDTETDHNEFSLEFGNITYINDKWSMHSFVQAMYFLDDAEDTSTYNLSMTFEYLLDQYLKNATVRLQGYYQRESRIVTETKSILSSSLHYRF